MQPHSTRGPLRSPAPDRRALRRLKGPGPSRFLGNPARSPQSGLYSVALITTRCPSSAAFLTPRAPSQATMPVPARFDRQPPERDTTRINERIGSLKSASSMRTAKIGIIPTQDACAGNRTRTSTSSRSPPTPSRRCADPRLLEVQVRAVEEGRVRTSISGRSTSGRSIPAEDRAARPRFQERHVEPAEGTRQGQSHDDVPRARDGAPKAWGDDPQSPRGGPERPRCRRADAPAGRPAT